MRARVLRGFGLFVLLASTASAVEPPDAVDTGRPPALPPLEQTWQGLPKGTELHGVSLYYGYYSEQHLRRRLGDKPSTAQIRVDRPGKHVVLFLSAYHTVIWDVKLEPGTVLEGIVLGGYDEQQVADGLVGTTRILNRSNVSLGRARLGGTFGEVPSADVLSGERVVERMPTPQRGYKGLVWPAQYRAYEQGITDCYFCRTQRRLHEITNLDFASFLAVHQLRDENPIVVAGTPLLGDSASQTQDGRAR